MINVAIVGMGFMGVTHIKAYRKIPNARIAAICDSARLPLDGDLSNITGNVGSAEPLKLDMSQVKATKNLDDLLADPSIDLIDLCVPTLAHPKLAIAALQAGKHVICEKPLARTAALARDIVEAARVAKGYFMPAMCIRFWPEYLWVKRAMDAQTYGRVLAARFRRVSEPPAWGREHFFDGAKSGGAILDLHIHDADFVQFCFGRPKGVFASGFTLYSGAIDHVMAQYQVKGGAAVSAEGSWVMTEGHGFNMAYTVVFEQATVDFDLARGADALRLFAKGQKPCTLKPDGGDGYIGELSHMVESIQTGRPPSLVTAQDGLSAVEICEAEERSIASGQLVKL
jgi:predicted dehydrogenase